MKKNKLLNPIISVTAISTCLIPITNCASQYEVKVEEVKFEEESSYVEIGSTRDFSKEVKVLPENATNKNLTWKISEDTNANIASVDSDTGVVTGISTGYAKLICTSKDGSEKSSEQWIVVGKYVPLEDFTLADSEKTIYIGEETELNRTFTPEDATTAKYGYVSWESSNPEVVSIDNEGKITGKSAGSATITALPFDYDSSTESVEPKENLKRECKIKVELPTAENILVTPDEATIEIGSSIIVNASVLPVDAKQDAQFIGTYPEGQTVIEYNKDNHKVTGKAEGVALVLFNSESHPDLLGVASITVSQKVIPVESIEFTDTTEITKKIGETWETTSTDIKIEPAEATVKDYKLESSKPEVAYVDPKNPHKIIAKSLGSTDISVVSLEKEQGIRSATPRVFKVDSVPVTGVRLTPTTANVSIDKTIQLSATVLPENATNKNVTWSSSDPKIATIDQTGLVKGLKAGTTVITVTTEDGHKSTTCNVTVLDQFHKITSIKLSDESLNLKPTQTSDITAEVEPEEATFPYVKWESGNVEVATVKSSAENPNIATITAVGAGSTEIHAVSLDGTQIYSNSCTVNVTYDPVSKIEIDETKVILLDSPSIQLTANVEPKTACQDVKWKSSDPSVIAIDEKTGELKALKVGEAKITCCSKTDPSKVSNECVVFVTTEIILVEKVELNPTSLTIKRGQTVNLPSVKLTPSDCTCKSVHWSVPKGCEGFISIKNNQITGLKEGQVDLICESSDGPSAKCHITIEKAPPIEVVGHRALDRKVWTEIDKDNIIWVNTKVGHNGGSNRWKLPTFINNNLHYESTVKCDDTRLLTTTLKINIPVPANTTKTSSLFVHGKMHCEVNGCVGYTDLFSNYQVFLHDDKNVGDHPDFYSNAANKNRSDDRCIWYKKDERHKKTWNPWRFDIQYDKIQIKFTDKNDNSEEKIFTHYISVSFFVTGSNSGVAQNGDTSWAIDYYFDLV